MKVIRVIKGTIVDGFGIRTSIYFAGCSHRCKNCHNKISWNPNPQEYEFEVDEKCSVFKDLVSEINSDELTSGITLSGGDPFYEPEKLLKVLAFFRRSLDLSKDIWVYTGYTFEEILNLEHGIEILRLIDILVDGRYEDEKKDPSLLFRGSSNQRLIDCQETMKRAGGDLWNLKKDTIKVITLKVK